MVKIISKKLETAQDIANEQAVVKDLARKTGDLILKNPYFYGIDYSLYRKGSLHSYLEIKTRNLTWEEDAEYYIGLCKFNWGKFLFNQTGKEWWLIVRMNNGDFQIKHDVMWAHGHIMHNGRIDRLILPDGSYNMKYKNDLEPCVHFPMRLFKKIGDGKTKT